MMKPFVRIVNWLDRLEKRRQRRRAQQARRDRLFAIAEARDDDPDKAPRKLPDEFPT